MNKARDITLILLTVLIIICSVCTFIPEPKQEMVEPSSIMMETVAHVPEEYYEGYTRVWADEETDRAVYIKDDYVPTPTLKVGDTVMFNGIECTVSSTDTQGVVLDLPETQLAQYGMSGAIVTYKDVPVALVSKAVSTASVYAIYY